MLRFCVLFLGATIVLVTFFHQGTGSNSASRLMTVYALVEHHTFASDESRGHVQDYAQVGGHIYSDKAPLSSLLVVPFYWLWRLPSHEPIGEFDRRVAEHLGIFLVGALPFAVVALLCVLRVRKSGMDPYASVGIGMAAVVGTSMFDWGAGFFGHMLAAAFFLCAYILAVEKERRFALAGFLGGCAVLSEYPLVLTQFLTVLYLMLGPERRSRTVRYCLGALPVALALLAYNKAITGSFFDFPYTHESDEFATMRTSFGIRLPSGLALWELLFGQYRGLACYSPVLLAFVPWIWCSFDGPRRRRNLVLAIVGAYVLLISSYFKWDGGWSVGPRHLMPVVALGVYEGLGAMTLRRKGLGWFVLFSMWGIAVAVAASATDPLPAESFQHPVFEVFFKKIADGDFTEHALLRELGLPTGDYLLAVWLGYWGVLVLSLGWLLARVDVAKVALAGAGSASMPILESRRVPDPDWTQPVRRWTVLGSIALFLGLLGVALLRWVFPVPHWTASSGFEKDHWPTSGSVRDPGMYHLFFHTAEEANPWVILDLMSERRFHAIRVLNREDCCQDRAVPLIVEASNDQKTWTQIAERREVFDVWTEKFPETSARYVRLSVPRTTVFHLEEVTVF